jgi:hypothetical protein
MVILLCLICSLFSFKVTNGRRSLTDITAMGKTYRRHNKVQAAGALEIVVTDSGNTALKVDVLGCKDYPAIHISRRQAKNFKTALAACGDGSLNVSVCQYKVNGKKYYTLYEDAKQKKAPIELMIQNEEKIKANCRTARSVAIVLYAFAILLHVVSWIASLVLIILATGIVYLNIPFLPDSKWDDECEFIKRPKVAPKDGKEQTDIIPSAASLVLQDIMGKYGLPGDEVKASEPENEPSQREPAKPQDAVPKELPVQHEQCESVSNSEKNAILEIKAIQADREDSLLDVSIDDIEPEPEMATVSIKPILDVQEDALEVDLADESNTEISLDLSSDFDGSANFQDAMSLEDELAAMEATLSASHDDGVFNPTDDELGEDEDDSLDLDSMLDVPGSPVDEAPDEPDVTEATKATTPVATEPPADTALPEQKDDSEQLPTKGKRSSRKKQKKDDYTPVTRTNAFQPNAKTQADEEDSSLVEKSIPFQTEAETRKERPKPTRTEHKKSSKTDAQTESLFGRDFQNRTKSGSGGSKKRSSSKKAQTIQSDGEQMRFDESNTDVIKCKV